MRVAILSSTGFGWKCLTDGILPVDGVEIVGVLTTRELIRISWSEEPVRIVNHVDFEGRLTGTDIPVAQFEGPMAAEKYAEALEIWKPDLLLALGWYYIIPSAVRSIPAKGCLGIHASLLPRFRGGAPLVWAMIEGEKETGVTLFHMVREMDAGDIVAQEPFPIEVDDTIATVYGKAEDASCHLLRSTLPRLADGTAERRTQDHSAATTYPQRSPKDGLIDWSWNPSRISNFIRAQTHPYPGAFFYTHGRKVTVWEATIESGGASDGCESTGEQQ